MPDASGRHPIEDLFHFMDDEEMAVWKSPNSTQEDREALHQSLDEEWRTIPDPTPNDLKHPFTRPENEMVMREGPEPNRSQIIRAETARWKKGRRKRRAKSAQSAKEDAPVIGIPLIGGEPEETPLDSRFTGTFGDIKPPNDSTKGTRVVGQVADEKTTPQEERDRKLRAFMPAQVRAAYDAADFDQKQIIWAANERAFEEAEIRKEQKRRHEQQRMADALDMFQRVKEDPNKANCSLPENASLPEILKWYEDGQKLAPHVPFPVSESQSPPAVSQEQEQSIPAPPSSVPKSEAPKDTKATDDSWKKRMQAALPRLLQKPLNLITEHPKVSAGGGALVFFLFAISLEFSGGKPWKVGLVAGVCYAIALLLTFSVLHEAGLLKRAPKRSWTGIAFAIVATTCLWYWLLPDPQQKQPTSEEIANEVIKRISTPVSKPIPVAILPKHDVRPLPIRIDANDTANILPLKPIVTNEFVSLGNFTPHPSWWPTTLSELRAKNPGFIHELVSRIEINNYGEAALLNVAIDYQIRFYEGMSSQGKTVSYHTHRITIPALERGKPFILYLVNETPYFVTVEFPKQAEVQVVGEPSRRIVTVEQADKVEQALQNPPEWNYYPSKVDWKRF